MLPFCTHHAVTTTTTAPTPFDYGRSALPPPLFTFYRYHHHYYAIPRLPPTTPFTPTTTPMPATHATCNRALVLPTFTAPPTPLRSFLRAPPRTATVPAHAFYYACQFTTLLLLPALPFYLLPLLCCSTYVLYYPLLLPAFSLRWTLIHTCILHHRFQVRSWMDFVSPPPFLPGLTHCTLPAPAYHLHTFSACLPALHTATCGCFHTSTCTFTPVHTPLPVPPGSAHTLPSQIFLLLLHTRWFFWTFLGLHAATVHTTTCTDSLPATPVPEVCTTPAYTCHHHTHIFLHATTCTHFHTTTAPHHLPAVAKFWDHTPWTLLPTAAPQIFTTVLWIRAAACHAVPHVLHTIAHAHRCHILHHHLPVLCRRVRFHAPACTPVCRRHFTHTCTAVVACAIATPACACTLLRAHRAWFTAHALPAALVGRSLRTTAHLPATCCLPAAATPAFFYMRVHTPAPASSATACCHLPGFCSFHRTHAIAAVLLVPARVHCGSFSGTEPATCCRTPPPPACRYHTVPATLPGSAPTPFCHHRCLVYVPADFRISADVLPAFTPCSRTHGFVHCLHLPPHTAIPAGTHYCYYLFLFTNLPFHAPPALPFCRSSLIPGQYAPGSAHCLPPCAAMPRFLFTGPLMPPTLLPAACTHNAPAILPSRFQRTRSFSLPSHHLPHLLLLPRHGSHRTCTYLFCHPSLISAVRVFRGCWSFFGLVGSDVSLRTHAAFTPPFSALLYYATACTRCAFRRWLHTTATACAHTTARLHCARFHRSLLRLVSHTHALGHTTLLPACLPFLLYFSPHSVHLPLPAFTHYSFLLSLQFYYDSYTPPTIPLLLRCLYPAVLHSWDCWFLWITHLVLFYLPFFCLPPLTILPYIHFFSLLPAGSLWVQDSHSCVLLLYVFCTFFCNSLLLSFYCTHLLWGYIHTHHTVLIPTTYTV